MEERLQKLISRYGAASRRQAEAMLREGRVRVNGNTASLGDTADDTSDVIELDGVRLKKIPEKRYIMLNKPRGYVTTLHDEQGRKNVSELVADCGTRVYPVGRLDQYSEGLLLLTNDGELANEMMHPRGRVTKVYHVWVSGYEEKCLPQLKLPIEIDGRMTRPAVVRLLSRSGQTAMLEFVLQEGRNRQIRRLCQRSNLAVTRLKRIGEGELRLGSLPVGAWRDLTPQECQSLRKLHGRD